MYNITIRWKNNEMETFENIDKYKANVNSKYLCLYADSHTWFIFHENILLFDVDYIGVKK